MSPTELAAREEKAEALEVKATKNPAIWEVKSGTDERKKYFVRLNGTPSCGCPDFQHHKEIDPAWLCKHLLAARRKAGLAPTEEEVREDISDLFSGPAEAEEDIATEEEETSCTRCGRIKLYSTQIFTPYQSKKFGEEYLCSDCAEMRSYSLENESICVLCGNEEVEDNLIPYQGVDGSGLICQECHDSIKREEKSREKQIEEEVESLRLKIEQLERVRQALRTPLEQRIARANAILEAGEPGNVEEYEKGGRKLKGYRCQAVVDAANEAFGAAGWKYEMARHEVKGDSALVQIELFIRTPDGWLSKGAEFGGCSNPNPADALKGAISDAIKKSFSLWGLGSKAYRGEL